MNMDFLLRRREAMCRARRQQRTLPQREIRIDNRGGGSFDSASRDETARVSAQDDGFSNLRQAIYIRALRRDPRWHFPLGSWVGVGEVEAGGGPGAIDLCGVAAADDGGGDGWIGERPGDGHDTGGDAVTRADLFEEVGDG